MRTSYVVDLVEDGKLKEGQTILVPAIIQNLNIARTTDPDCACLVKDVFLEVVIGSKVFQLDRLDSVCTDIDGKITANNMEEVLAALASGSVYTNVLINGSASVVPCLAVDWNELLRKGPVTFRIIE